MRIGFIIMILLIGFVSSLSFSVEVPKEYARVAPGEEVFFEIKVLYPENLARKDLILEYSILNEEGRVIAQADTLRAIETQLSLLGSIVVPEDARVGEHSIRIGISDNEGLNEETNASFNVSTKGVNWSFVLLSVVFIGIVIYFGFKFKHYWNMFWIRVRVGRIVRARFRGENKR